MKVALVRESRLKTIFFEGENYMVRDEELNYYYDEILCNVDEEDIILKKLFGYPSGQSTLEDTILK